MQGIFTTISHSCYSKISEPRIRGISYTEMLTRDLPSSSVQVALLKLYTYSMSNRLTPFPLCDKVYERKACGPDHY